MDLSTILIVSALLVIAKGLFWAYHAKTLRMKLLRVGVALILAAGITQHFMTMFVVTFLVMCVGAFMGERRKELV
jgi:hypothetical protein